MYTVLVTDGEDMCGNRYCVAPYRGYGEYGCEVWWVWAYAGVFAVPCRGGMAVYDVSDTIRGTNVEDCLWPPVFLPCFHYDEEAG